MIFDYFFIKFYNGMLKSTIPEFPRFYASFLFGVLIVINLMTIDTIVCKLDILPFVFNKPISIVCHLVITSIIYFRYKNSMVNALKFKFSDEAFKPKKETLNVMFVLFIVLTILAMFIVPLYKPGYLPKMFD